MEESRQGSQHKAPMTGRLHGRAAFITGAGSGIGRAAATLFAREGAMVAIAEVKPVLGQQTADAITAAHGTALFVQTDVTHDDSVQAAINATVGRFGKLDLLFNCAGGSLLEDASVTEVDLSVWDQTMNLDLKGTFLCCRHAIPCIVAAGGGTIVNMSSGAALRGASPKHIYTAAKGAVVALTRSLACTFAKQNVRVNAICSGRVNTERVRARYSGVSGHRGIAADPNERAKTYPFWLGEPEDIANIALFLSSHESRMITGAAIPADGGHSAY